jgi:hypothetical protein
MPVLNISFSFKKHMSPFFSITNNCSKEEKAAKEAKSI